MTKKADEVGRLGLKAADLIFFAHPQFKIPFRYPKNVDIAQIKLYVSNDQGRNWQFCANADSAERYFEFRSPQDGAYWFAVQTVDSQGRLFPKKIDDLIVNMKVVVDTKPPTVNVKPLAPRECEVGVLWTVMDENLDLSVPDALQLQYRAVGGT